MADGNISSIQLPNGGIYNVKDNTSGFITGMTILSYGTSTWNDFTTAYNANKVVYCRASSNSNPASGSQTRLAFMAYVNNAESPTEVEFQYYRSVSSHSDSQQGDQVYVYKLTSSGNWTVTTREASTKIAVSGDLTANYASGTLTISATIPTVPTNVSSFTNDVGYLTSYTETDPVFSASAAAGITSTDISNWNAKVSDDKTWNGIVLEKISYQPSGNIVIPYIDSLNNKANYIVATSSPSANILPKYDANAYLKSTTPSANDNSTKVATTAYVDTAVGGITIPTKTSDLINDSGFVSNFVITVTEEYDETLGENVWSMDKTITEINEAYAANKNLVCVIGYTSYTIPFKYANIGDNDYSYYFERVTFPYSDAIGTNQIYIHYDAYDGLAIGVFRDYDKMLVPATTNSSFVIPTGGTTGQVIMKNSNYDYDFSWTDLPIYNGTVV